MNELSGNSDKKPLSDAEVIRLGFCPDCHCPESKVTRTRKLDLPSIRTVRGKRQRVVTTKIIRYRQCVVCGRNFRTTEEVDRRE